MNFIKIPGKDFEMADAPVTQAEWQEVMGNNPSRFKGENNPVEMVSWNECQDFIKKLKFIKKFDTANYEYRFPTEDEWEFCAKPCDNQKLDLIAWYWENSRETTHPIKQKQPNEFGLYDMLGNVWEWTASLHELTGSNRVVRGGGWGISAQGCRSGLRYDGDPGSRSSNVGFRLVRTLRSSLLPYDTESSEAKKRAEALKQIRVIRAKLTKLERLLK